MTRPAKQQINTVTSAASLTHTHTQVLRTVIQTQKGSNERLVILTRTHSMHIFGEIPFIKPQNDT